MTKAIRTAIRALKSKKQDLLAKVSFYQLELELVEDLESKQIEGKIHAANQAILDIENALDELEG